MRNKKMWGIWVDSKKWAKRGLHRIRAKHPERLMQQIQLLQDRYPRRTFQLKSFPGRMA